MHGTQIQYDIFSFVCYDNYLDVLVDLIGYRGEVVYFIETTFLDFPFHMKEYEEDSFTLVSSCLQ